MTSIKDGLIAAKDLTPGMVCDGSTMGLGEKYEIIISGVMNGIRKGQIIIRYKAPAYYGTPIDQNWTAKGTETFRIASKAQKEKALKELEAARKTALPNYFSFYCGADPEIFVVDGKGEVIPSWKFLGSKKEPSRPLPNLIHGNNAIYWDGLQAEFDVAPEICLAWVLDSVQRGLAGTLIEARKFDKSAKLSNANVLMVPDEVLSSAADEHIQFGCMPSKNAYGLSGRTEHGRNVPYRFAGGHIHFGCKSQLGEKKEEMAVRVIKAMDAIVGVACVSLFAEYDAPVRREFYGLAGEYRLPPHGIEYRTLSNSWLIHPLVANMVFDLARKAAAYGLSELDNWNATEDEVIRAIQNCDVDLARSILRRNEDQFERIVGTFYLNPSTAAKLYSDGLEKFIANPEDIEGNWGLAKPELWQTHCDGPMKNWKTCFGPISKGKKV